MAGNVLIIGGSRGIGAEAVRRFTSKGYKVVFTYHKSELDADALRQQTGAVPVRCDIKFSNSAKIAIDKAVSVLGSIDVLICNAEISDGCPVTDIDETRWEEVIDTNLNGTFYCIKYALPSMMSRKSGRIITISSKCSQVGDSFEVAYAASKAGVIGLTKAIAREVEPSNIRVNCIAPEMEAMSTDEVVKAMEFLVSEDAASVTGQVIGTNGKTIF